MNINVYAEEVDPLVEPFEIPPIGQLVEKEKDGVRYYGMQVGISEFNAITYWFTSMKNLRRFFVNLMESLP